MDNFHPGVPSLPPAPPPIMVYGVLDLIAIMEHFEAMSGVSWMGPMHWVWGKVYRFKAPAIEYFVSRFRAASSVLFCIFFFPSAQAGCIHSHSVSPKCFARKEKGLIFSAAKRLFSESKGFETTFLYLIEGENWTKVEENNNRAAILRVAFDEAEPIRGCSAGIGQASNEPFVGVIMAVGWKRDGDGFVS